jgi:hypothetical protein
MAAVRPSRSVEGTRGQQAAAARGEEGAREHAWAVGWRRRTHGGAGTLDAEAHLAANSYDGRSQRGVAIDEEPGDERERGGVGRGRR